MISRMNNTTISANPPPYPATVPLIQKHLHFVYVYNICMEDKYERAFTHFSVFLFIGVALTLAGVSWYLANTDLYSI